MAMGVLNGLSPNFEILTVVLQALVSEHLLFTLEFLKNRPLQEEKRFEMRELKTIRRYDSFAL